MNLLLFFLAIYTALCDIFTSIALTEAKCILVFQYYNSTAFNLLTCYQVNDAVQSTTSWSNCTKRCCDPNKVYEQVRLSLENCDQDRKDYYQANSKSNSSSIKAIDILTWIMFGILVLGIFVLIIIGMHRKFTEIQSAQQSSPQRVQQAPVAPSAVALPIESDVSSNPFRPYTIIRWTKQRRRDEVCPICLLGDTRVELAKCRHMVHWECWKEWSKRKSQCALCRSNNVNQLKIFCYSCKNAYFTCRNDDMQRLSTCPKIVCDDCKGFNRIS